MSAVRNVTALSASPRSLFLIRSAASAALGLMYLAFPWMELRVALRDVLAWALSSLGWGVVLSQFEGAPSFVIAGLQIHFTPDCTYLDLFLLSAPFFWDWGAGVYRNALRLCLLAAGIGLANVLRLVISCSMYADGHSWFVSHDLADDVIYWPFLVAVIVACNLKDRTFLSPPLHAAAESPCCAP